jgi:sugar transferase (PEP-CTERM/EpsH1 system associated)
MRSPFAGGLARQRPLVCHVIDRLDYGGLENGVINLINWMPANRYDHAVLCLRGATRFGERIHRTGVQLLQADKQPGKDLKCYARVHALLRALKPAIVHTRNVGTIDMIPSAWLAGVRRFVHSEHGLDMHEVAGDHARYNQLRRVSRLWVDHYVSVSADLAHWLTEALGVPRHKLSVVYNGVDTERFRPTASKRAALPAGFAPADAFVIGTAGRIVPVKDPLALVASFIELVQATPLLRARARLVMAGDGELRPAVEAALQQAGVRDLAWLPGFRDDMPDLYRCFDVFALPSKREGISNTALEAMACGVPVIATSVGGSPEIVADGATGRLVAAGDRAALTAALDAYAADPGLVMRHGAAARRRAADVFSPSAMVRGYSAVYDALTRPRLALARA